MITEHVLSGLDGDFTELLPLLRVDELEQLYAAVGRAASPATRTVVQCTILEELGAHEAAHAFRSPQRQADLCTSWDKCLNRSDLARQIASAAWWLQREEGIEGVNEVVRALLDACTWWP